MNQQDKMPEGIFKEWRRRLWALLVAVSVLIWALAMAYTIYWGYQAGKEQRPRVRMTPAENLRGPFLFRVLEFLSRGSSMVRRSVTLLRLPQAVVSVETGLAELASKGTSTRPLSAQIAAFSAGVLRPWSSYIQAVLKEYIRGACSATRVAALNAR